MSTSSGSGSTATVAVEVWIRPWASVSGTRWTRWTPPSNWRWRNDPSPDDAERDLAEAAQLGRLEVEDLELPAHLLGEPPVHLEEVAGEQGRLVAAGAGPDLDDQGRMAGAGACGRRACRGARHPLARCRARSAVELGLGVGTHLGVGLAGAELLGLGDLPAQLQVAAVGERDLRQRAPFPRQGRDPRRVGRDLGVEQRPLDLQESLIIGLELLEHRGSLGESAERDDHEMTEEQE